MKNNMSWRPALQVFSEISTWIGAPIILAVIGGKALDKQYGTFPWLILTCAAFAFLISSYGIVKAVRKYAEKLKKDLPEETVDKNNFK